MNKFGYYYSTNPKILFREAQSIQDEIEAGLEILGINRDLTPRKKGPAPRILNDYTALPDIPEGMEILSYDEREQVTNRREVIDLTLKHLQDPDEIARINSVYRAEEHFRSPDHA